MKLRLLVFTANSVKVVLPKARTVNHERARDDGLLLIFTFNSELCRRNIFKVTLETDGGKYTSYKGSSLITQA